MKFSKSAKKTKEELPEEVKVNLIPWELVKEFRAFLIEDNSGSIKIAAVDPKDPVLQQFARSRFGEDITWSKVTEDDIESFLKNYKGDFKDDILKLASTSSASNNNVTKIVDGLIKYAITEKASDVHIEPVRKEAIVRLRIDGTLHNVINLPRNVYQAVVARFKILSNLKIDEYRRPQDGRIESEDFPNTSIRISTIPTLFGEKIALRILDDSLKNLSIEQLGFSEDQKAKLLENIEKPFGMIVASGPTGSGKTTTLYSLLQLLKREGINIATLEDPIEYVLPGVNQTQINTRSELTFPSGLRALLRQDPDIIMVGEVRDSETAIMAANAAMTGHLVFTTIHTNDAPSAYVRLLEMKVEDFVVSSTVNLIIAQRLVRKVCDSCATKKKLNPVILKKIKERKDVIAALETREKGLSEKLEKQTFKAGKGCEKCFQSGYLGRIGIFEMLEASKEIHDLILEHESSETLKRAAEKNGFKDMITDGLEKVFNGKTTFEELLRVTKIA